MAYVNRILKYLYEFLPSEDERRKQLLIELSRVRTGLNPFGQQDFINDVFRRARKSGNPVYPNVEKTLMGLSNRDIEWLYRKTQFSSTASTPDSPGWASTYAPDW